MFGEFRIKSNWQNKVWQMDRFWPLGYHLYDKIWLAKVWQITDDSPNFPTAKHYCYLVH